MGHAVRTAGCSKFRDVNAVMQNIQVCSLNAPAPVDCLRPRVAVDSGLLWRGPGGPIALDLSQWICGPLTNPKQLAAVRRLADTLKYMVTHLTRPITISTLSAMAGLSSARFFELFKTATGDTPLNWIIQARMRIAADLLAGSELQIKEIADRVGYEDQFYFSRLFKAVYGIAPSGYRAQRQTAERSEAVALASAAGAHRNLGARVLELSRPG